MRICLIGMPGCGKTSTGKKLSEMADMMFVETDILVETHFKLSIPEIFNKFGENAFREVESEMFKNALSDENVVIATGGGLPCLFDHMKLIKQTCFSIYLQLNHTGLLKRLENPDEWKKRPLLKQFKNGSLNSYILNTLSEREKYYNQADIILNAEDTIENICRSILDHLKYLTT